MESNETIFKGLEIDNISQNYLSETSKWAKFLSILGFLGVFFILLIAFVLMMMPSSSISSDFEGMNVFIGIFYLVFALAFFFPCLYLLRFSDKLKVAIAATDQIAMEESFSNLKSFFKFLGVLLIIFISFSILSVMVSALSTL